MNALQIFGTVIITIAFGFIGVYSGKKVSTADDFTVASGRGSTLLVMGISLATLIGGATTIGTAQTAFSYGLAGLWYTLGSSVGFMMMALFLARKLREGGHQTMTGIISDEFGKAAELIASFVLYVSMAISLASQMISSLAVLSTIFPSISGTVGLVICFLLTITVIIYGGSLSAGSAGKLKTLLISIFTVTGGLLVLKTTSIPEMKNVLDNATYFNLFSRGTGYELSNGIATSLGICCSQANVLAAISARDNKTASKGMIICAIVMPVIGIGGVLIGMFMKIVHPEMSATLAFSRYMLDYFPSLISGIAIGTLFITLILSAAGTSLGCSTVFVKNVLKPLSKSEYSSETELKALRLTLIGTLFLATLAGSGIFGDSVLSFAFLSMSLRSATLVIPFVMAVFFKGKADRRFIVLAEIMGPVSVIFFGLTNILPIDELYISMPIVMICVLLGVISQKRRTQ